MHFYVSTFHFYMVKTKWATRELSVEKLGHKTGIYLLVKDLETNPYLKSVDGNPLSNKIILAFCLNLISWLF